MKFIAAILVLLGTSVSAQERPAHIASFNGFTVVVNLAESSTPTDYAPAEAKAQEACTSVGKTPQLQTRETVANYRFMLVYVCL
ncbi:MAG: hypothetical protein ACPG61_07280 [Paracoccaceae bacterium]